MILALLAAAATAATTCSPLPGAEVLFANPAIKVLWVGEMHGTTEQPALFADLICAAARTGRPVVVALERQQSEQPLWDAYMQSGGTEQDRVALLKAPNWGGQDGRSSRAMLILTERLRQYRGAGLIVGVRMIIPQLPGGGPDAQGYEASMAEGVGAIVKAEPSALVVVYSGNAHARKGQAPWAQPTYTLAAGLLPRESTFNANVVGGPGQAWFCDNGCSVRPYPRPDHGRQRIEPSTDPAYDFMIYTGAPSTASLPAVGDDRSGHND